MMLHEWAMRYSIDSEALNELRVMMGTVPDIEWSTLSIAPPSEAGVQVAIRLEASNKGIRLFRNNVGACMDPKSNRLIRYGLCNESKAMNEKLKSADLVGIRPVLIEQHHVGMVIGQFVARECKPGGWIFKGTKREIAQRTFIEMINALGGDARFADSAGTL